MSHANRKDGAGDDGITIPSYVRTSSSLSRRAPSFLASLLTITILVCLAYFSVLTLPNTFEVQEDKDVTSFKTSHTVAKVVYDTPLQNIAASRPSSKIKLLPSSAYTDVVLSACHILSNMMTISSEYMVPLKMLPMLPCHLDANASLFSSEFNSMFC